MSHIELEVIKCRRTKLKPIFSVARTKDDVYSPKNGTCSIITHVNMLSNNHVVSIDTLDEILNVPKGYLHYPSMYWDISDSEMWDLGALDHDKIQFTKIKLLTNEKIPIEQSEIIVAETIILYCDVLYAKQHGWI